MQSVRFRQPYSSYNAGEVAGFPGQEAEQLIKSGVATKFSPKANGMDGPPADRMIKSPPQQRGGNKGNNRGKKR